MHNQMLTLDSISHLVIFHYPVDCCLSASFSSSLQFYRLYVTLTTKQGEDLAVVAGKMIEELASFRDQDLILQGRTMVMVPSFSMAIVMNALCLN